MTISRILSASFLRLFWAVAILGVVATACASSTSDAASTDATSTDATSTGTTDSSETDEAAAEPEPTGAPNVFDADADALPVGTERFLEDFGDAPEVPTAELSAAIIANLDIVFGVNLQQGSFLEPQTQAFQELGASGDPRLAWLFSDLLRIANGETLRSTLVKASSELTGTQIDTVNPWKDLTDRLIAWDTPAPPDYLNWKTKIYTIVVPEWEPLFDTEATEIDWRYVSWGGVGIDARPFAVGDQTNPLCSCIPSVDNPEVTNALDAGWLDENDVVFGIELNGESRAYPRSIMEVREMVNDTLGGRDLGIPYCTLCGSAQAYFTDDVPEGVERPILRTSGLLSRSNKVMYDLNTFSVFDTFLGEAVTGPLAEIGVSLNQASVLTTTWGDWVAEHPDTTVLIEGLGLGRNPNFRNNRDANGPIFPVGDVDPRLAVQEDVLGVVTADGQPLAFHSATARSALRAGQEVVAEGVQVRIVGGGLQATTLDGEPIASHEAFWFAWSQFHPETALWPS